MAKTEDALRAKVPAICRAYCAQTWEEALNRAGINASSELRRPKNIFFPSTIQVPKQKEAAPPVIPPAEDAQLQNPPPPSQREQAKEVDIQKGTSSDKIAEVLQPGATSVGFEKDLVLTILPMGGASKDKDKDKDKDKEVPPETTDKTSKSKL